MTRDEKRARIIFAVAIVLAIIAAPFVYMTGSVLAAKLAEEYFYRTHPLLSAMRAVHHHQGIDWDARDVLLQRLPLGTPSRTVLPVLAAEGLTCIAYPGSTDMVRRASNLDHVDVKGTLVSCGASPPTELGQMEWNVSLSFGEDGRLLDASVRGDWLFL